MIIPSMLPVVIPGLVGIFLSSEVLDGVRLGSRDKSLRSTAGYTGHFWNVGARLRCAKRPHTREARHIRDNLGAAMGDMPKK